jgi:hypothetical protein
LDCRRRSVIMAAEASREPARDSQDLERRLVSRQRAGDVDGMVALYEPNAVLDFGGGRLTLGREAIRTFYAGLVATGRKFAFGDQRPCIVTGDLASTRLPDGSVTAEVARRKATRHGSSIGSPWRSVWRGTPESWKLPARSKRSAR